MLDSAEVPFVALTTEKRISAWSVWRDDVHRAKVRTPFMRKYRAICGVQWVVFERDYESCRLMLLMVRR